MLRNFAVRWTHGGFCSRVRDESGALRNCELEFRPGKPFRFRFIEDEHLTYQPHEIERGAFAYEAFRRANVGMPLYDALVLDFVKLPASLKVAWILVADAVSARYGASN
jgi:hypothetical protein